MNEAAMKEFLEKLEILIDPSFEYAFLSEEIIDEGFRLIDWDYEHPVTEFLIKHPTGHYIFEQIVEINQRYKPKKNELANDWNKILISIDALRHSYNMSTNNDMKEYSLNSLHYLLCDDTPHFMEHLFAKILLAFGKNDASNFAYAYGLWCIHNLVETYNAFKYELESEEAKKQIMLDDPNLNTQKWGVLFAAFSLERQYHYLLHTRRMLNRFTLSTTETDNNKIQKEVERILLEKRRERSRKALDIRWGPKKHAEKYVYEKYSNERPRHKTNNAAIDAILDDVMKKLSDENWHHFTTRPQAAKTCANWIRNAENKS